MKKSNPPDTIYLQWYEMDWEEGEAYYDPLAEITWCADEINDSDIEYLLSTPERVVADKLLKALEANMRWVGAPPIDRHSFDSTRENAWKLGMEVRSEIHEEKKEK